MPALGFGSSVGSRLPDLANFPQSGLVALYKCDERSGDKLYDATGNYPAMTLATGSMLDCTAGDVLFADTTGFLADTTGEPAIVVVGAEFITPAAAGSGTEHHLITRNTAATDAPIKFIINEITTSGKFRIDVALLTSLDGAPAASVAINSGNDFRLEPSTHYQVVVRIDLAAATPHAVFSYRQGVSGQWRSLQSNNGTAGTHLLSSAVAYRLLAYYDGSKGFKGKICSLFAAVGDIPLTTAQTVLDRFGKTNVGNTLGLDHARFWTFRAGTGTLCRELITDTVETLTGTVAWTNSLSGCTQQALRQGSPYYGRPGVLLGGEDGFGAMGGGAVSTAFGQPVASVDGWTVQATFKVGNHLPAAETVIASFYGPDTTGAIPAIGSRPGVHFTLNTSGVILARIKRLAGTSDTGTGVSVTAGAGTNVPANGLLTTFTVVCSSAGAVDVYRQHIGETTPTLVVSFTTNAQNIATRADRAAVGQASMDGNVTVGYLCAWSRPITTTEMAHCHSMAVNRMRGHDLYANQGLGMLGDGSENAPFSTLTSALRASQPSQIINVGAGAYSRISTATAGLVPSSTTDITVRGTGTVTFTGGGAKASDHPAYLNAGSWTFSGCIFDANDDDFFAFEANEDVTSLYLSNCTFKDAYMDTVEPIESATGTGLTTQCPDVTIIDCISSGNDEHGVYLRRSGVSATDGRFIIDGLVISGCTEDGLKVTNETAYGARYRNSLVNRLKVTGGKNQLYLLGVSDSVVTNVILIVPTTVLTATASAMLGNVQGFSGEDLVSDYPLVNVTVANMTVVGSVHHGIWLRGDLTTGSVTLKNIVCEGGVNDFEDDTTAGTVSVTYCAGDSVATPFPVATGNIPAATILFTNAGAGDYTLTEESDGYAMGTNLTGLSNEAEADYAGTARPATGAWNMGAY